MYGVALVLAYLDQTSQSIHLGSRLADHLRTLPDLPGVSMSAMGIANNWIAIKLGTGPIAKGDCVIAPRLFRIDDLPLMRHTFRHPLAGRLRVATPIQVRQPGIGTFRCSFNPLGVVAEHHSRMCPFAARPRQFPHQPYSTTTRTRGVGHKGTCLDTYLAQPRISVRRQY